MENVERTDLLAPPVAVGGTPVAEDTAVRDNVSAAEAEGGADRVKEEAGVGEREGCGDREVLGDMEALGDGRVDRGGLGLRCRCSFLGFATGKLIAFDLYLWSCENTFGDNARSHNQQEDGQNGTSDFVEFKRVHSEAPTMSFRGQVTDGMPFGESTQKFSRFRLPALRRSWQLV